MSNQLRLLRPESDAEYPQYECPDCGDWVAEWQDCPHCGWYDGDVWVAAAKRRENETAIEAAETLNLEAMR